MPPPDTLLVLLACVAAGAAAMLTMNLLTGGQARLKRRADLIAEVRRRRSEYAERIAAEMAVFEAEFSDVELEFEALFKGGAPR